MMTNEEIIQFVDNYGPMGLIVAAIIIGVRAYLSGGSSGLISIFLNGLMKAPPSRAETYALHAAQANNVIDPVRKVLELLDKTLEKVQRNNSGPTQPPADEKKPN